MKDKNYDTRANWVHRAFTLLELLIVIAIIGLLAAILFPVFSRVRENARRSSCQSNLKQIGLGLMQYVQDYDERYIAWTDNGSSSGATWQSPAAVLQPYVKSGQVFRCPSNTTASQSYSYNFELGRTTSGINCSLAVTGIPRVVSYVELPAQTPVFIENRGDTAPAGDPNQMRGMFFHIVSTGESDGRASTYPFIPGVSGYDTTNSINAVGHMIRHLEGSNFAFADGHVKWYSAPDKSSISSIKKPYMSGMDFCPGGDIGTASTIG